MLLLGNIVWVVRSQKQKTQNILHKFIFYKFVPCTFLKIKILLFVYIQEHSLQVSLYTFLKNHRGK